MSYSPHPTTVKVRALCILYDDKCKKGDSDTRELEYQLMEACIEWIKEYGEYVGVTKLVDVLVENQSTMRFAAALRHGGNFWQLLL